VRKTRKLLTIFTVLFLFTIVAPALASDYSHDSEVDAEQFSEWTIENVFEVKGEKYKSYSLYVWMENPDKWSKLNRVILKFEKELVVEFICWNENATDFSVFRRFEYNFEEDRYDEITDGEKKWVIE